MNWETIQQRRCQRTRMHISGMGITVAVVYAFGSSIYGRCQAEMADSHKQVELSQEYQSRPTDPAARNAISWKTYQELYRQHRWRIW